MEQGERKPIYSINLFKSILAGVCISIGCVVNLSITNKVVGALLFSVGLLTVLYYQLDLYTGKVGKTRHLGEGMIYVLCLLFNMIGAVVTYILIKLTPIYTRIEPQLKMLVHNKQQLNLKELFVLGIFCGVLMLFATKCKDKNPLLSVLCVAVFILCGFEHSVADSFYLAYLPSSQICIYFLDIVVIALGNGVGAVAADFMIDSKKEK